VFEKVRLLGNHPDESSLRGLLESPADGRLKMYLIWRTLCARRHYPDLFERGEYFPLEVRGAKAHHVVAFGRKFEAATAIVIVPRLVTGLLNDSDLPPIGPGVWEGTHILFPDSYAGASLRHAATGADLGITRSGADLKIDVSEALRDFPVFVGLSN
jgi:(1->4)-alpha-D-glucan 1-alpha-D-glucosylmutase